MESMIHYSMKMAKYQKVLLYLLTFSVSVYGDVQFQYDSEQCLDQPVEYQCTVTGSLMRWRILDDEGTSVGTQLYDDGGGGVLTMIGVFTVEQLQGMPSIITNISFTVQSSINGYTIICEDVISTVSENFTIQIPEPPSIPLSVMVHNDSFTNSAVRVSWAESSFTQSRCFGNYHVNVSSTTKNIIMESTSNSVMVEGLVPSDDEYSVVVTAIDTANRTSNGSDPVCFIFNVPSTPGMIDANNMTVSDTMDNILVTWTFEYEMTSCTQVPVMNFVVSIFNTTDDLDEVVDESEEVPSNVTSFTFEDIPKGRNYTVEVFAANVVGDGDSIRKFFPEPQRDSNMGLDTSSSTTQTPSMTNLFSISASQTFLASSALMTASTSISSSSSSTVAPVNPTVSASSNVGAIAGGVAGGVIVLLLIIVVIVVVVFFFVYRKGQTKSVDLKLNEKGDNGAVALQEKTPDVGQALYSNDMTDGGGAPDSGIPTYQDPSTIQREQAPTGDLYAMPDKKQPPPTQTAVGGEYAELDLTNKASVKATSVPTPSEDPSSVVYSDVRAQ